MPPRFIAEVSSNHHGSLDRCLSFIDAAARLGCDAVKFQLFRVNQLFAPEILRASQAHRQREAWELPVEFLPHLWQRCRDSGIEFGCTPFYLDAVNELMPYVDFYKIASYELLWADLLGACAQSGKPVILSTGMATILEVQASVKILRGSGCRDLTLLHCVSGYPTPCAEANLAAIETIRNATGCRAGWSDHSRNPGVIARAVHRWGASVIEFHLDLDGKGDEYKSGHCWLPDEIAPVIDAVKSGFLADGNGIKAPAPAEMADRDWRTDPADGLRPFKKIRLGWKKEGN